MAIQAKQPPPAEQQVPYLPPGPEPLVLDQFEGVNTSTTRPGVPTKQMAWSDTFFRVGPRDLRTLYGQGPVLFASFPLGVVTVFFDFANIGATPFAVVFTNDGAIWGVKTITGIAGQLAGPGTIQNPSRSTVGITQSGSAFVLIVAQQPDGYFAWDGTTFYRPGDTLPGDSGGVMPTGISGNCVETYQSRVWVSNGATIFFSAPESLIDFTVPNGGGDFTSSDSFLRVGYTALRQSSGFLYLVGDSSLNYISNVQTGGIPLITTFTNQNADPEVGTPWAGTVDTWGRNLIFANPFGAHISYGATATKISEPLDGVYNTVPNFGGLQPSAAKSILFGKKVWILLLPIIDPLSGQQVNKFFIWDTKAWFPASQIANFTFIQHQEIDSVITAWGTDGNALVPLFTNPDFNITKTVQSRLWDTPIGLQVTKSVTRFWGMVQYYDSRNSDITLEVENETPNPYTTTLANPTFATWINNLGDVVTWKNNSAFIIRWSSGVTANVVVFEPQAVGQAGALVGMTLSTNSPDLAIISAALQPDIVQGRY